MEAEYQEKISRPTETWVYKPGVWDHPELRAAYHHRPNEPPESIKVALLDMSGEKTPSRTLQADHDKDILELEDAPAIRFVNLRYMSTNCEALCRDHVADHRFIIMVSVRRWENIDIPEECYIHNFFIQPDSAQHALDILNFFQFHLYDYLKKATKEQRINKVLFFNRPRMLQECTVKIHWRKLRKTWTEKRTVVLDSECVIFYRKPFEDAHEPWDRMFLWYEQFRRTVSKVSHIKSQNCILLHSLFMYIVVQYDDTTGPVIEAEFKEVLPVPRKAFTEPEVFFHWLEGNYDAEKGEIIPPAVPEPKPVELDEEQRDKLDQFEREMNEGLFELRKDESQMIWNNMRPSLEQALINNKLPAFCEADLGAKCDPNSVDFLLRIVSMIEDELFRNVQYDKALAIAVVMKKVFEKSQVERLWRLLADSPVDILHKIHARGNIISQRSRAAGEPFYEREFSTEEVESEGEGYLEEEEEEEDMEDEEEF